MVQPQVRRPPAPRLTRIAALIASSSFAALLATPVGAQEAVSAGAPADAAPSDAAPAGKPTAGKGDVVGLDRVVVTASSARKSKMRSSVSVTDVDQQQVADFGARSEAEVLHLIPGIRAESSAGPGGNSNITVRGLPIASGGSKYVQLQEDGLPVVQFGDMNFANNDYWSRFDSNVDNIQTIRGGSSSVFASHAPGAVINFLSKTGRTEGGSLGLTRGLNYDETRVDGEYGGKLAPGLRYHVGGYYREGEGPRKSSTSDLRGYQIKGNLTKDFNDGKGYARVYFKVLDEQAPTYTSMPAIAHISGNTITGFSRLSGLDVLRDSQSSIYNSSVPVLGPVGTGLTTANLHDGISVNSKSVGFEVHNELDHGITFDDKFRYSVNSGSFRTQFLGIDTLAGTLAGFGSGTSAVYANGPLAGQAVTQANLATGYISRNSAIAVQMPDMGNVMNDLSLGKRFELDGMALTGRAGLFHSRQNVKQVWAVSERLMAVGRNGALIDVYDSGGAALTTMGLTGYNNGWGACCARSIDVSYTTDAPYASLNLEAGDWDFDAGLRRDMMRASGSFAGPKKVDGGFDVNGDGVISGAEKNVYLVDAANAHPLDYKVGYNSYSLGTNYRFSKDASSFVRYSKGGRAIADRLLFSSNIDANTGALAAGASAAAVARVKQSELGLKLRGNGDWGNYGLFATVFHTSTDEYDFDQTRTVGPKLNVVGYSANGLELESVYSIGDFALNANAVFTKAEITKDLVGGASGSSTVGNAPAGTPRWMFTITPRYALGQGSVGFSLIGQTGVYSNNYNNFRIQGRQLVNAFANYQLTSDLTVSFNVNNLFNKITPSAGVDQGSLDAVRSLGAAIGQGGVVSFRPEAGRTASVSLRYAL